MSYLSLDWWVETHWGPSALMPAQGADKGWASTPEYRRAAWLGRAGVDRQGIAHTVSQQPLRCSPSGIWKQIQLFLNRTRHWSVHRCVVYLSLVKVWSIGILSAFEVLFMFNLSFISVESFEHLPVVLPLGFHLGGDGIRLLSWWQCGLLKLAEFCSFLTASQLWSQFSSLHP